YDQGEKSVFVSVRGDSSDEITELWAKLAEGSTIISDLAPSQFSPAYGMLTDAFGVTWVLDVAVAYDPAAANEEARPCSSFSQSSTGSPFWPPPSSSPCSAASTSRPSWRSRMRSLSATSARSCRNRARSSSSARSSRAL